MTSEIIQQGAEAIISLSDNQITKDRISKSYRLKELDDTIRKRRTKSETKLLEKASQIINSPFPKPQENKFQIQMPFIDGKKLSEHLDSFPLEEQKEICTQIGESIAKLHDADIIHGDLTTSNIIYKENEIYFIDFGLGFQSRKYEDKAVDLHLLRQALEAKHFQHWEILFDSIITSYKISKDSEIALERLKAVEKRGRYKH